MTLCLRVVRLCVCACHCLHAENLCTELGLLQSVTVGETVVCWFLSRVKDSDRMSPLVGSSVPAGGLVADSTVPSDH